MSGKLATERQAFRDDPYVQAAIMRRETEQIRRWLTDGLTYDQILRNLRERGGSGEDA
jgi:hypothetical protein